MASASNSIGLEAACLAARRTCVAAPSPVGVIEATGADRLRFLHGMLTHDVKAMGSGDAAPSALLDAKGRVRALLTMLLDEERTFLETASSRGSAVSAELARFAVSDEVEFADRTAAFSGLTLAGPEAPETLRRAAGEAPERLRHAGLRLAGAACRAVRTDELGVPTIRLWVEPGLEEASLAELAGAGASRGEGDALETLRIEAGLPAFGVDVGPDVLMPEAGLEERVSYTKGCFLGQETVARVKYRGHVNRLRAGLLLDGDRPLAPGAGVEVGGAEVGRVTSACWSFALGRPVAQAFLKRELAADGVVVSVIDGGGSRRARVSSFPLVRP